MPVYAKKKNLQMQHDPHEFELYFDQISLQNYFNELWILLCPLKVKVLDSSTNRNEIKKNYLQFNSDVF